MCVSPRARARSVRAQALPALVQVGALLAAIGALFWTHRCEHVPFHDCIGRRNGGKVFINPRMLIKWHHHWSHNGKRACDRVCGDGGSSSSGGGIDSGIGVVVGGGNGSGVGVGGVSGSDGGVSVSVGGGGGMGHRLLGGSGGVGHKLASREFIKMRRRAGRLGASGGKLRSSGSSCQCPRIFSNGTADPPGQEVVFQIH